MIYVDTISYSDCNMEDMSYSNYRLPILQSSSNLTDLTTLLKTKYTHDEITRLKEIHESLSSEHVISINMSKYLSESSNDIIVTFYKTANEAVSYKLANLISKYKVFSPLLLKTLLTYDDFINSLPVSSEDKERFVITLTEEISKVGNSLDDILEIIDYMKDNIKLKAVALDIAESINEFNKYSFNIKCSLEELLTAYSSLKDYYKYYVKEIQYQLVVDDIDICIGVSRVDTELLPLFDIAGISENIFKETKYVLDVPVESIIIDLSKKSLSNRYDFVCALNYALAINSFNNSASASAVVMHELVKTLLDLDFACRGDLYKLVVSKSIK